LKITNAPSTTPTIVKKREIKSFIFLSFI
jgi:hypothetical protein